MLAGPERSLLSRYPNEPNNGRVTIVVAQGTMTVGKWKVDPSWTTPRIGAPSGAEP